MQEDPNPATPVANTTQPRSLHPTKKHAVVITLLALLVLAGLAAGAYIWNSNNNSPTAYETIVCNDELLQNVSGVLKGENVTYLEPRVLDIMKLKDYDKDPNCLNVVVTYYIHISDYVNARAHLDKLEKLFDPEIGFSPKLGRDIKDMATLLSNVNFLESQNNKTYQQGGIPSPRVGE